MDEAGLDGLGELLFARHLEVEVGAVDRAVLGGDHRGAEHAVGLEILGHEDVLAVHLVLELVAERALRALDLLAQGLLVLGQVDEARDLRERLQRVEIPLLDFAKEDHRHTRSMRFS